MKDDYEFFPHYPNKGDQIKALERNASPAQKPFIKKAFEYVSKNKIEEQKVDKKNDIINRIFSLADYLSKVGSKDSISEYAISDFFDNAIVSSESVKKFFPYIKKMRLELFSKEEPLFPNNPKKAIEWLKKEGEREALPFRQNYKKNHEQIKKLEDEILIRIEECNKLTNHEYRLSSKEKRFLPYPGKKDWRGIIPVWEGTPLAKLEAETKKLFERTSFTQITLIIFVLTGIKPVSSPYKISKDYHVHKGECIGREVTLHIYRPLTKEIFNNIQCKIKEFFGKKGRSFSEEKHYDLYDLVDKLGGSPKKNKGVFWKNIQKEINKKHPEWFNDPKANGPRITYNRIIKNSHQIKTQKTFLMKEQNTL